MLTSALAVGSVTGALTMGARAQIDRRFLIGVGVRLRRR